MSGDPAAHQIGQAKIVVEREQQGGSAYILVKVQVPVETRASSFFVSSPPRIVVDLEGTRIKRSQALAVPKNAALKQIRLGSHPEKLRVVLDVFTDPPPQFSVKQEERFVTIRIAEGPSTPKPLPPTATATPLPATPLPARATPQATSTSSVSVQTPTKDDASPPPPTQDEVSAILALEPEKNADVPTPIAKGDTPKEVAPVATTSHSAALKAVEEPAPTASPTPEPTQTSKPSPTSTKAAPPSPSPTPSPTKAPPTVTPRPSPTLSKPIVVATPTLPPGNTVGEVSIGDATTSSESGTLLLVGYRFDYLQPGKIPVLKVALSRSRTQAQMSKVDPKTYKIVIPGCGLSSAQLSLPQFPPADFVGFTMVAAQEVESKVELTITVEPGVTLGTFVRNNEIWIKRL